MVSKDNLNRLYECVILGKELTTKELNSYGFNSKDINELIEQGIIERVKRGYYSFTGIDQLFSYGKELVSLKNYDQANICFNRCYDLNPRHSRTCFQLFVQSLNRKDYEAVFKYFNVLMDTENPYHILENNFYLYLLNMITDIPEEHREYARYLKYEDIRVDFNDRRYQDVPQYNKIRVSILQRKFPFALKQLRDLTEQHGSATVQDIITRTLLFQVINVETKSKNTLIGLAKSKQYNEIVQYLEEKQRRYNLSITDTYTLKLAKQLIDLIRTKKIPKANIFETENLFEAIDGYNYKLALNLNKSYNAKAGINDDQNVMNLLLADICEMIRNLSLPKKEIEPAVKQEVIPQKEEVVVSTPKVGSNSFSDVISYLMKSDLETAFQVLKSYLESINKKEYEFLIVNLIKLSVIEKDVAFTKPMITLTYISRDNFTFDMSTYIQEFYVALSQNKFDVARVYLDIISKASIIGQNQISTEALLQVLNAAESIVDDKKVTSSATREVNAAVQKTSKIEEQPINPKEPKQPLSGEFKKAAPSEQKTGPQSQKEEKKPLIETRDSEKEFIESKHNLLLNGEGIVLLKPMNRERRKRIHHMVEEYHDMKSFSIGEDDRRQIVLRYKPQTQDYIDIKKVMAEGNTAYNQGNYDLCIANYLRLLQYKEPIAAVYAKLGLAYMKKWNKEKAIDYLTIATELSKQEDKRFDFSDLIASLKGLVDEADKKPRFKMQAEEFESDKQENYGIENIDQITEYVLETGTDVESACQHFGLMLEQVNIVRLLYAKGFYSQGNYDKGDQFLKVVEQSDNKTKKIMSLIEEIRKNKKFYINRRDENGPQLVLTLKPKKDQKNSQSTIL